MPENLSLKQLRKNLGLRQREVADKLGITTTYWNHIETGAKRPSYWLIHGIAKVFNISVEQVDPLVKPAEASTF